MIITASFYVFVMMLTFQDVQSFRKYLISKVCKITSSRGHYMTSSEIPEISFVDSLSKTSKIFIDRIQAGDNFKLAIADALAGDFDSEVTLKNALEMSRSAPVVMFSWTMSPACKKAKKLLNDIDVEIKSIELNQPWKEGNPIRASLGRHLGKTSVPMIFIGGVYLGGCEDGPNKEAPGLVPLAFQGKLRSMLQSVGSLKEE